MILKSFCDTEGSLKDLMQDWISILTSELMTHRITAGRKCEKSEFAHLIESSRWKLSLNPSTNTQSCSKRLLVVLDFAFWALCIAWQQFTNLFLPNYQCFLTKFGVMIILIILWNAFLKPPQDLEKVGWFKSRKDKK